MKTHADPGATSSVASRVAQLPHLPMDRLWGLWDEYFDERPNHHHRTWLESRPAYWMQEREFGALKGATRRKPEDIGETGILPQRLRRDADRLLPGTVLSRTFEDVEHRVLVRAMRDYEYNGQRFTSLSAVAHAITGTHWSGPLFFGLKTRSNRGGTK